MSAHPPNTVNTVADPDLEPRGGGVGGSFDLLALLAFLPSAISSFFFFTQNKGDLGPSPRSTTGISTFQRAFHMLVPLPLPQVYPLIQTEHL